MKSQMLDQLRSEGNDIDEYLNRYEGDEETCELLTGLFANDDHTIGYFNSYSEHDYSKCRDDILAVKGASSNVGLSMLAAKAKEILIAIDSGSFDRLEKLNEEFRSLYDHEIDIITSD